MCLGVCIAALRACLVMHAQGSVCAGGMRGGDVHVRGGGQIATAAGSTQPTGLYFC